MERRPRMSNMKSWIICLSLIISMLVMGIGYAAWTDETILNAGISTGKVNVEIINQEGKIYLDLGQYIDITVDDKDIDIEAKVYPNFNHSIKIDIEDIGSVPVEFKEIEALSNENNITLLERLNNKENESFKLTIKTEKEALEEYRTLDNRKLGIEKIKNKISKLENAINEYRNLKEEHSFEYKILFKQIGDGNWDDTVTIKGKIIVVPNPEILSEMEDNLVTLEKQLKELEGKEAVEEDVEVEIDGEMTP